MNADRINGARAGEVVGGSQQQEPTHFAVPIPVFQAVQKIVSSLPWDQVNVAMRALSECQPLALVSKAPEGATKE